MLCCAVLCCAVTYNGGKCRAYLRQYASPTAYIEKALALERLSLQRGASAAHQAQKLQDCETINLLDRCLTLHEEDCMCLPEVLTESMPNKPAACGIHGMQGLERSLRIPPLIC